MGLRERNEYIADRIVGTAGRVIWKIFRFWLLLAIFCLVFAIVIILSSPKARSRQLEDSRPSLVGYVPLFAHSEMDAG
jgi:hypothetical protein